MTERITFRNFKDRFKDLYSAKEVRHLFKAIKEMDKETRGWVVKWFVFGTFPEKEVEGMTVEKLIDDFGFKPLNAFITIDWLKADPAAAKYFIWKAPILIGKDGEDIKADIVIDETGDETGEEKSSGKVGLIAEEIEQDETIDAEE